MVVHQGGGGKEDVISCGAYHVLHYNMEGEKVQCIKCRAEIPADSSYCPFCGKKQVPEKRKALKRTNGMGTVYKLQGRRKRPWVAAKNKVIIGYYEKKQEAQEALERLAGKDLTERYNMTFKEVFEEWKKEHYKEIDSSSIRSYDRAYDVFESLHDKKFRKLRKSDFQEVIDQHMDKTHSTVSKYKHLITQMSRWAIREELIVTNFASFVTVPEKEKSKKPIFSDEDIKKLEEDGSETARIILMLLSTGMRIGELFSLPVKDCHEKYVVGGEKTEAGRDRVIPIRPEGREHFSYFAERAKGDLLLSGHAGEHDKDNFRKREYYPLLNRLGIEKKTPHATRHTYATRAVMEGTKPELLQLILGHEDYAFTVNTYTNIAVDELIAAVEPPAVTNTLLTNSEQVKKDVPGNT